tara:strand:+ start:130 stop:807 length:678 start_codon:yes stop_codon:yes gene_type:complete
MNLQQLLLKNKKEGLFYPIVNESLISRGRNSATAFFLHSNCDYMLFVDTDMSFSIADFNELAKLKKPLTIGAYCKKYIRQSKLEGYAKAKPTFEDDWESHITDFSTEIPRHAWGKPEKSIKVNYGATGFMLIHRSVFETIIKQRPDLKYTNDIDFYMSAEDNFYDFFTVGVNSKSKKYESEDYGFCQLWKECGGQIYCATNTNLTHIGRHNYKGNLYKQLQFWNA